VTTVTVDESRAALHRAVWDLWTTVTELVLSTNDDQPEESDLAAAEHVAQLAVEIQARLADALNAFTGGAPANAEDALRELFDLERLLREASLIYWQDLRAHGPASRLRGSTRRRGGAWPSWWSSVEQSLERCEEPLIAAGEAVSTAWHELLTPPPSETTRTNISRRSS
jgi:hypothetical protein